MKKVSLFIFLFLMIICSGNLLASDHSAKGDSVSLDSLRGKMEELRSKVTEIKPKADELKTKFAGYASRKCPKAAKEINDGLDMAKKAVKNCDEVNKMIDKALNSKKPKASDFQKVIFKSDLKIKEANFFIKDVEDRVKEVEFELRGC